MVSSALLYFYSERLSVFEIGRLVEQKVQLKFCICINEYTHVQTFPCPLFVPPSPATIRLTTSQ